MTSDTMNAIRNRKNSTLAIPAAAPATPVKPKIAAMIATMKKPIAQLSMTASNGWIATTGGVQSACRAWARQPSVEGVLQRRRGRRRGGRRRRGRCHRRDRRGLLGRTGRSGRGGGRASVIRSSFQLFVDRRLGIRRQQGEGVQVVFGHFAHRPEPNERWGHLRPALGTRT